MSKLSKACDISPKVRAEVKERDGEACIICGKTHALQIAHFIPRSRLGLGIPENLACMCIDCHGELDNGFKKSKEIKQAFKDYLMSIYPEWNESKLIYSKWS